jgi:coproporphyrinogen III oxidase-like Fe-S oxidoreductase
MGENNVSDVVVLDPVFFLDKNRAMVIMDLIEQELPNANFSLQTRFENLDEDIISRIFGFNIKLECGLQTLDDNVQRKIRRVNNRTKVWQVINQLIQHKIEFETHLIYYSPNRPLAPSSMIFLLYFLWDARK